MDSKARITIARTSPDDMQQREIYASLDGQELAIMRYGETVTREVEPGRHLLRAHNTLFWKKLEIDLQPGEHARFTAVIRAGWGTYAIASVLGAGPIYLTFERAGSSSAAPLTSASG